MASMRKLRRRLLRWERYAWKTTDGWQVEDGSGHERARIRWRNELARQHPAACSCNVCWSYRYDQRKPEPYDSGCCLAGDDGHDGPCVIRCDGCTGNGFCPECGGLDDLGCWHCDGTGSCPCGCDDGEIVLGDWFPRGPDVVTVPVDRSLL